MAALSAWRPGEVQSVVPLRGSRQKNWPLLRAAMPKRRSPLKTGEFMYMR